MAAARKDEMARAVEIIMARSVPVLLGGVGMMREGNIGGISHCSYISA